MIAVTETLDVLKLRFTDCIKGGNYSVTETLDVFK